jgi:hypothetical protein
MYQPDIDRLGVDAFVNNIVAGVKEDLDGGQSTSFISEYYLKHYGIDVTVTLDTVNVRLYTESNGWNQSSTKITRK